MQRNNVLLFSDTHIVSLGLYLLIFPTTGNLYHTWIMLMHFRCVSIALYARSFILHIPLFHTLLCSKSIPLFYKGLALQACVFCSMQHNRINTLK
jgi:hypothetical protein